MAAISKALRSWSSLAWVARAAAATAGIVVMAGPVWAERRLEITAAGLEQLLSKVKAEHPNASILKIEHELPEGDGKTAMYEIKLLRRDGQILKLYYDAATLEPVMRGETADGGEHRRRRERRRGNW